MSRSYEQPKVPESWTEFVNDFRFKLLCPLPEPSEITTRGCYVCGVRYICDHEYMDNHIRDQHPIQYSHPL